MNPIWPPFFFFSSLFSTLVHTFMSEQRITASKLLGANFAVEWLLASVGPFMCLKVVLLCKPLWTNVTMEWFLAGVGALVNTQGTPPRKPLWADLTVIRLRRVVHLWCWSRWNGGSSYGSSSRGHHITIISWFWTVVIVVVIVIIISIFCLSCRCYKRSPTIIVLMNFGWVIMLVMVVVMLVLMLMLVGMLMGMLMMMIVVVVLFLHYQLFVCSFSVCLLVLLERFAQQKLLSTDLTMEPFFNGKHDVMWK